MSAHQWLRSRGFLGFVLFLSSLSFAQNVRPLSTAELDSLTSNRQGKVLVVNVWATWCTPCKEEFPDLIRLAKTLSPDAFELAAISVDYPDEIASKIIPFVSTLDVPFPIYVSSENDQERFINTLNRQWTGAIPATFIYDSTGRQRAFLIGKQEYSQLKKAVEDVYAKP